MRAGQGLTQRHLARLAKVSAPTLVMIERHGHEPNGEIRARLAQVLGTPEAVLFPSADAVPAELQPQVAMLANAIATLLAACWREQNAARFARRKAGRTTTRAAVRA